MRHPSSWITRLLVAVALVASLAVVGCSRDSGSTAIEPQQTGRTKVEIGFAAPLTGDNAIYGQGMKRAVELAFKEANASEDVRRAGYEFVLRAEDDQGDPKQAVNVANALASDVDVVGVVGHFDSGCSIPASTVYEKAGLPMISVCSNPELTAKGYQVVNRIVAKDDAQGVFAANLLFDKFACKSVVLINDSTQYGQGLATEFRKAFESKGGVIVSSEDIQPKTVDFSALVAKIMPLAPSAIYYAGAQTEGGLISKQMKEGGLQVPLAGCDLIFSQEYINVAGAANAEGDIATTLGLPLEQQPRGQDFKAAYTVEYGRVPEAYDSYAYDQAWIFVNAVLEAGPDRSAVIDAVREGSFNGVTGVTEFDENGDTSNQAISWYRVKAGLWEQGTD